MMTMVGSAVELEADGEALDDVGAVPGLAGTRDRLDRAIVGAGVIFGDPHDQRGDREADEAGIEQVHAGEGAADAAGHGIDRSADLRVEIGERDVESRVDRGDGEDRRGPKALVKRAHDRALGTEPDHVGADDRGDDADAADQQRQDHQRHQQRRSAERERDRHHGDADGHDIGLEQVGGHSGAVADIVADVVRDHRRVAGIVLGNSGLDLADEVGADVGGLGEDAAAKAGEDRYEAGAEGECGKRGDDRAVVRLITTGAGEVPEQHRDREEREAGDEEAGDGAGAEGGREAALQAVARGLGGSHVGADRDVHADEAGGAGQDRTDQKGDRRQRLEEDADNDGDDDPDDGDRRVLALQVGAGAFLDRGRHFDHARVAGGHAEHLAAGDDPVEDGDHAAGDRDIKQVEAEIHGFTFPCFL